MADEFENLNRIPESYEINAPRFDDDQPEELPQFLEHIERMMELAEIPADQKNTFVVRYACRRPAIEWKQFDSYKLSYKRFKKEILENYPAAKDSERGSIRGLKKALKEFGRGEISLFDRYELMKLARSMNVEGSKLLASRLITNREIVAMFMEKLDENFREKILHNLDLMYDLNLLPGDAADDEATYYTFNEVIGAARRLVKRHDSKSDYFATMGRQEASIKVESMSPARVIEKEMEDSTTLMLDEIRQMLGNLLERMEMNEKKLSLHEARIAQLYQSLPANSHHYSQNEYDMRDDEILTLKVERAALLKQIAHYQQQPRVQTSASAQSMDINLVSTLLATVGSNLIGNNLPTVAVGTRANPFRTGISPPAEAFVQLYTNEPLENQKNESESYMRAAHGGRVNEIQNQRRLPTRTQWRARRKRRIEGMEDEPELGK